MYQCEVMQVANFGCNFKTRKSRQITLYKVNTRRDLVGILVGFRRRPITRVVTWTPSTRSNSWCGRFACL